jgi:hypothetical protein
MNQAERIKKLMRKAFREVSDGAAVGPRDDRILGDASMTMKRAVTENTSCRRVALWRTIMKSPYTKTAAVVAIGLAVFSVLFPPRHGIGLDSVAIADVQKAVQAQETVFATGTRTITFDEKPTIFPPGMEAMFETPEGDQDPVVLEFTAENYLSPQGVAMKIYTQDGQLVVYAGIHNETGEGIVLLPTAKAYVRFEMLEAYHERMAGFTIQGLIDLLYRSGDYRKVGPKRVQGIDAVGLEVSGWEQRILEGFNPAIVKLLFNLQNGTGRIWIDPKTNLPIQSESELELKPCVFSFFKSADVRQIDDHFQWGVEIDASVFRPEIPEDYQELTLPSGAALGVAASSVLLAGIAPWCVFFVRRRRRRRKTQTMG